MGIKSIAKVTHEIKFLIVFAIVVKSFCYFLSPYRFKLSGTRTRTRSIVIIVFLFLVSLPFKKLRNQNKNQILSINDWNREREKCIPMEHRCDGRSIMIKIHIKILLEPFLCICIYSHFIFSFSFPWSIVVMAGLA